MTKPKIYLDTNCFIELVISEHGKFNDNANSDLIRFYKLLIQASKDDKVNLYTSMLTVSECLSINDKGEKYLDEAVKNLFNRILLSDTSGIIPVQPNEFIVIRARNINWDGIGIKKPLDLLHLASAIEVGCIEFVTNDKEDFTQNIKEKLLNKYRLKVVNTINECKTLTDEYKKHFNQESLVFPEEKQAEGK